ncbi:hypothetical protein MUG91_G583n1 [Manis pentadactyla]|nr:hypothetical protein MUG91_G583n1 [Manis pentadactyla]
MKVPVDTFGLWTLIRDSSDLRHEGFKIENVKEHALGTGQATKENESNLASPAISPSAPPLEAPEGQEPSYHEPDSGWDEEMEEEQSPLVEEALVQLCDKEIQTIEIASIGSSKKVYPSLLTATQTIAADPSRIPFKEWWDEIQGTLKWLTLALEAQQKMGQPHPERRDFPVSKAETAPLERAGFDPVQPISSEQTKEKTVERKTEKGLEQKEKQPIESKEEKPPELPVNMQKRQRKVTPLEAVLQQAQYQGEDTQEFFGYPVLEQPGDNREIDWLLQNTDAFPIALAHFMGVVDNHYPQVKLLQFAQLQEFVFPHIISSTPIEGAPTIFTDGSSNGTAVYVVHSKVFSHCTTPASAQVVELRAVALVLLHFSSSFNLYSDSQYVVNAVSRLETVPLIDTSTTAIQQLFVQIQSLLQQRTEHCYIGHICAHTMLPGPLTAAAVALTENVQTTIYVNGLTELWFDPVKTAQDILDTLKHAASPFGKLGDLPHFLLSIVTALLCLLIMILLIPCVIKLGLKSLLKLGLEIHMFHLKQHPPYGTIEEKQDSQ